MATRFSQVNLTQDEHTGELEYTVKNNSKRKRHTTSNSSIPSPEDFEKADNSTKLNMIFEEILNLKIDQASTRELISVSNQFMKISCEKINGISSVTNQQSALLKTLSYKSIDIEARGRRNNLIFRGIKESCYENCRELVFDFLANTLQIDTTGIVITRVHRIKSDTIGQRAIKPIVANFMNHNDVEHIMANAKLLKNCPGYSIDRDLPKEIVDARKRLWGLYKDTKKNNPGTSVRIVYPAKLLCGNRVVRDEFPDWHAVLSRPRIVNIPVLEENANVNVSAAAAGKHADECVFIPSAESSSPPVSVSSRSTRSVSVSVNTEEVLDLSQSADSRSSVPSLFSKSTKPAGKQIEPNVSKNNTVNNSDKATVRKSRSTSRRQTGEKRTQSASTQRPRNSRAGSQQPSCDNDNTKPIHNNATSIDSG